MKNLNNISSCVWADSKGLLKAGLLCAFFVCLMSAQAATYTWVGGSGAGWATASNWSPAGFPIAGNASSDLILNFNSSSAAYTSTKNIGAAFNVHQLNFEEGTGDALTTITLSSSTTPMNFVANGAAGSSIAQNSSGGFLLNGSGGMKVDVDLTLKGTGSGLVDITTIISGTGGIVINGSAPFALRGNNTFSGGTTVNSGTLRLGSSGTVLGTGSLTINNGKVSMISTGMRAFAAPVNVGTGAVATFGDAVNTGALTFSGPTVTGANATIVSASNVAFAGAFSAGDNLTLSPGSGTQITLSTLDASNGLTLNLNLGATGLVITGALTDAAAATINFNLIGGVAGQTYTLMTYGSTTWTYANLNLLTSDYALDTSFGNGGWLLNGSNLQIQLIPEPSSLGLFSAVFLGAMLFFAVRCVKRS